MRGVRLIFGLHCTYRRSALFGKFAELNCGKTKAKSDRYKDFTRPALLRSGIRFCRLAESRVNPWSVCHSLLPSIRRPEAPRLRMNSDAYTIEVIRVLYRRVVWAVSAQDVFPRLAKSWPLKIQRPHDESPKTKAHKRQTSNTETINSNIQSSKQSVDLQTNDALLDYCYCCHRRIRCHVARCLALGLVGLGARRRRGCVASPSR